MLRARPAPQTAELRGKAQGALFLHSGTGVWVGVRSRERVTQGRQRGPQGAGMKGQVEKREAQGDGRPHRQSAPRTAPRLLPPFQPWPGEAQLRPAPEQGLRALGAQSKGGKTAGRGAGWSPTAPPALAAHPSGRRWNVDAQGSKQAENVRPPREGGRREPAARGRETALRPINTSEWEAESGGLGREGCRRGRAGRDRGERDQ